MAVGLAGGYFMSKRGSGEWDLIPATQLRAYSDVYYPAYLINRSTGEVVLIGLLEGQRFYRIYSNPNKGKFGDPAKELLNTLSMKEGEFPELDAIEAEQNGKSDDPDNDLQALGLTEIDQSAATNAEAQPLK